MANTIRIKRSAVTASPPSLAQGELAWSEQSKTMFIGETGSNITPVAGDGVFAKKDSPALTGTPTAPTAASSDNSTKIATTAFVKAQNYLTQNQTITLTGDITGTGTTTFATTLALSGVVPGTWTKLTVDSKGRVTVGANLAESDIPTLTASKISDFNTQVRTNRLDQMSAPATNVDMAGHKVTGVGTPTLSTDAANKDYVDNAIQGVTDVKQSCRVATTDSITLSGEQTIDGIAVVTGDRVLVKDQSSAKQNNGIYIVSTSTWSRSTDCDTSSEVTAGLFTFITEGTVNKNAGFMLTTPDPISLGTTELDFVQFSGAGQIIAGGGMTKSGNTLDIGEGNGITVNADTIEVKLDGSTLSKSSSGLKVTDNTYAPYAHVGAGGTAHATVVSAGNAGFMSGTDKANLDTIYSDYLKSTSTIDGGNF